jgi:hypothetical protein
VSAPGVEVYKINFLHKCSIQLSRERNSQVLKR